MTSDRIPSSDDQRLIEYANLIFSGKHASRAEIDPALADLVLQLKQEDRVPPFDPSALRQRKDALMQSRAMWPVLVTESFIPAAQGVNGTHALPMPMPGRAATRPRRSLLLSIASAAVLLALIGGVIFGIVQNRGSDDVPAIPAVIQASPSPEPSLALGANWAQFRGGVERTGYTTDPGPGGDLNLIWTFTADEFLNPIVEADGKVVAYGSNGGLYAIDALTGEQIWATDLSAGAVGNPGLSSLPAIDDGKAFVSTLEGELVAVDLATGEIIWALRIVDDLPAIHMNPIAFEGVVYVAANGDQLLGFDEDTGEQVWEAQVPGTVRLKSAAIAEGRIFIADDGGRLHAFDLASGKLVWSSENIAASWVPAYQNGVLFVPGSDERTTAISADDGTIVWQTEPPAEWFESLNLIVTDDAVIAIGEISSARALDPATGELLWAADLGQAIGIDPHAGGDTLYIRRMDSTFAAFSLEDGSLLATTGPYMAVGSTAAISGNMLFLSGLGGTIRAFGPVAGTTQEVVATPPVERTPAPEETDATPTGSPVAHAPLAE